MQRAVDRRGGHSGVSYRNRDLVDRTDDVASDIYPIDGRHLVGPDEQRAAFITFGAERHREVGLRPTAEERIDRIERFRPTGDDE